MTACTETIEWHRVSDQLPETERTVLIDFGQPLETIGPVDSEAPSTWLGYFTRNDGWLAIDATTPALPVLRWAEMPKGGGQ